jgi:hypothetical protein
MRTPFLAACALWIGAVALPLAAQDAGPTALSVSLSSAPQTVDGSITGSGTADYLVTGDAGQILSVDMQTTDTSATFNILPAGSETALFIGSTSGTVADVPLPAAGDYLIRVYLMRNAARRDETALYSLSVGLHGPDYAGDLSSGPDFWQVAGLSAGGSLNLRNGPATRYDAIGILRNGDVLRNDGCRLSEDMQWCRIRAQGTGLQGWVAAQYLAQAAAPLIPTMPEGGPTGNGTPFDATGTVSCTIGDTPRRDCPFGVVREGPGNAGVWIGTGSDDRQILFEAGVPVVASPAAPLSYDRAADTYRVRVGPDRFDIPQAVVYGG